MKQVIKLTENEVTRLVEKYRHSRPVTKSGEPKLCYIGNCLYYRWASDAFYFKGQANGKLYTRVLGKDLNLAIDRIAEIRNTLGYRNGCNGNNWEFELPRRRKVSASVYVIGTLEAYQGRQLFKIGMSINPPRKLKSLQLTSPVQLKLYRIWRDNPHGAYHTEQCLHRLLAKCRLHGEWFNTSLEQIDSAYRMLTRCYKK